MEQCSYCLQNVPVTPVGRGNLMTCVKCKPYIPEFSNRSRQSSESSVMEPQVIVQSGDTALDTGVLLHCPLCNKTFEKSLQYHNHMRNHRAERKFCCPTCGKAFSQSNNLRAHLRIHSNERPYKCAECGKAFTQVTNLNNHLRLHTGERPFACTEPGCDKAFAQVTNLNNHKKCHQREPRNFECEICHKSFQYRSHLTLHKATHGPVRGRPPLANRIPAYPTCKNCSKIFETEKELKKHTKKGCNEQISAMDESKSENLKCFFGDCNAYFEDNESLKNHLSRDHQLPINLEGSKTEDNKESIEDTSLQNEQWQDDESSFSEEKIGNSPNFDNLNGRC